MLKRALSGILLLCLTAALSCAAAEGTPYLKFTDSTGHAVVLDQRPERVAVLFSSFADIFVTAGGTVDITVGDSVKRGFATADAVLVDDTVGQTALDLEALVAAEPDLVIGTADLDAQVEACEFMASQGVPSALFRVENLDDYLSMLKICTEITGNAAAYAEYGEGVAARAEALLAQADAAGEPVVQSYLFIRAGSTASSTKAKTAKDNFVCEMIDRLGAHNIADDAPLLLDGLSLEAVVVADPDYIFVSTMGDADAAKANVDALFQEAGWRDLTAVRNGSWSYLEKELFHYKPNARWADAYRALIEILYPELEIEAENS